MQNFNKAYYDIKQILGEEIEAIESVQLVEKYRRFFKPDKVRLILLAESHVYTHERDRQIPILSIPSLPGYPEQYARFVYCLGYGEKSLTDSDMHPNRDGTPQFWKILYSCCNNISSQADFNSILGKTSTKQRIKNKIQILNDLKNKGIWLVDASIVALYKDGRKIPFMFKALKKSWESYTRDVVISSEPEHVICIGKGVAEIVRQDLDKNFNSRYTVIPQPNAFLKSQEHLENYKTYSQICLAMKP